MFSVSVLGAIQARLDGQSIPVTGAKQRALLTSLALASGRAVSVDALVGALWDSPPRDPSHALQTHISRLRAALPVTVAWEHGGYRLHRDELEVDAITFAGWCEQGRGHLADGEAVEAVGTYRKALALWRGDALADVPITTTLRPAVTRLESLRASAEADLIDARLHCGDAAELIDDLRAAVDQDRLDERRWSQLMMALHQCGRRAEALQTYQRVRAVFEEELGSGPPAWLDDLHVEILREGETTTPLSAQRPTDGASTAMTAPRAAGYEKVAPQLAGRRHELDIMSRAWQRGSGSMQVVTITGEPGIGKTALARGFIGQLERAGARSFLGRCDASVAMPYQPMREWLRGELTGMSIAQARDYLGDYAQDLIALLPDRFPTARMAGRTQAHGPPEDSAGTREDGTFTAIAGWLTATSAEQPLLLLLDDLHWADPATVALLHYLVRRPTGMRLLLIVTCRDRGEPSADDGLVPLLVRQSETVTHIPLGPLPDDEGEALLRAELDGADGGDALAVAMSDYVVEKSGGNPLFIVELARQALLTPAADRDALLAMPLPSGIVDVITQRLAQLSPAARNALELASVMGRRFDPHVLAEAGEFGAVELDGLLASASRSGLIVVDGHGLRPYAFQHDVVRAVLYDAVSPMRRGGLHFAIGEAITKLYGIEASAHVQALAYHYSSAASAGVPSAAPWAVRHLMIAGDAAMREHAPSSALKHFRAAADLLPDDIDSETYCDVLTAMGTAEVQLGDSRYRETLLRAARIAHDLGDTARLTAAALANSRGWYSSTMQVDAERVALIETALKQCTDQRSLAVLETSWALENVRDPERRHEVLRRSQYGLEAAAAIGDPTIIGQTMSQRYVVMYATFSDPDGCVAFSERFYEFAHTRHNEKLQLQAAIGLAQSPLTTGEWALAERGLERALELAFLFGDQARLWMLECWQATMMAARGELAEASERVRAAFERGHRTAQPDAETWYAGQLFTLGLMTDRLGGVLEQVGQQVTSYALAIPSWRAAYALTLARSGQLAEAAVMVEELTSDGRIRLPLDMLWLPGMAYLAETAVLLDQRDAASALYDTLLPYAGLVAHNGTIDAGPVHLHLGMLAVVCGRRDQAQEHLAAAVAQCVQLRIPVWKAKAELYAAAALS